MAPWELLEQPLIWRDWATAAENAENEAHAQQRKAAIRTQNAQKMLGE